MANKCVLVVLDGLGDRAHPELGGQTPLQAAWSPFLDSLARRGANGLYHADVLGRALPSELAHFSMFGYREEEFPGRGALEALGAGVPFQPGEVAVLTHLVCLERDGDGLRLVKDKPPALDDAATEELLRTVGQWEEDGVSIRLHPTGGGFGILVLSGPVSPLFTDTNPLLDGRPLSDVVPRAEAGGDPGETARAETASRAMRRYLRWAFHELGGMEINQKRADKGLEPVNGLVTQRPGVLSRVEPFHERHGMRGASIASGIMFPGLAGFLGMRAIRVEDSGDPEQDLAQRVELAREALADNDYIHVHTKAPDKAAHRKDPRLKKRVIESLDKGLSKSLPSLLDDPDVLVIVTADHSTPSAGTLVHSGETVPLVMCGTGLRQDEVERFDEVAAAWGCLGQVRGRELMYLVLNHLDRAILRGIRNAPRERDFWPDPCRPFSLEGD